MQSLVINVSHFCRAFGRDVAFQDLFQLTYLDRESGTIDWFFENDADADGISPENNAEMRQRIAIAPEPYLKIPGLTHGNHHDLLKEWLDSDWTEDEEEKNRVEAAYFGSIGGWKEAVDDDRVFHAFCDFREHRIKQLAEGFCEHRELSRNGGSPAVHVNRGRIMVFRRA